MMELTAKQRIFADNYIKLNNATEAYKIAYPAIKNDKTAQAASSRLLSNVIVQAYIQKTQAELQKKETITIEKIVNELAKEAFGSGINDVAEIDDNGKLKLKPGANLDGVDGLAWNESVGDKSYSKSISVKRKDKAKALEQLCKVLGIGHYGTGQTDPGRTFESNASRVLSAIENLRGKK